MDVIDVNKEQFQEVEIKGHYGIFTELRVDKKTIPADVNCYELCHGDDDSYPATLEESVRVNYFGAVLMTDKMELGQDGYIPLEYEDFGFTGDDLTMLEYRANYGMEPENFVDAALLVQFMNQYETPFELSEIEADKLLDYMSGHDFILGHKDGRLFRGDSCYEQGKVRWREDTIDDVIDFVSEQNYELLKTAQAEMENPHDFIDFANKKSRFESLQEDYEILDKLFDRSKYGIEIEALAQKLAEEFIRDMQSKGGIDGAIQKMTEQIAAGKDLLPDVSQALKQNSGKAR